MADLMRIETPFPCAGEGVSLMFSNRACAELQKRFGAEWFTSSSTRLNNFDTEYMAACVEVGSMKDGKPAKIAFDAIDAPLMKVAEAILDALYVSVHGQTFVEYLIEASKRMEALEGTQNPTSASSQANISPI